LNPRSVLLTGGTGFLGTLLAKRLLEENVTILALVRARDREAAEARLRKAWWDWPQLSSAVGRRIIAVPGDIRHEDLGMGKEDLIQVRSSVGTIINAAADLRLNEELNVLRETNVEGVRNLLEVAKDIDAAAGLHRFSHVSTAYVCGRRKGEIDEESLGTDFSSTYEESKAEGERLVRISDIPFSIFRPVMVVGESQKGWVRTFNTLYYPLRLYLTGHLRIMPMDPRTKVNMVPGDLAADAIVRITLDPRGMDRTAHLVPPEGRLPTVAQLMDLARSWALAELDHRLPRARFIRMPARTRDALVRLSGALSRQRGKEGDMSPLLAYLEQEQSFRRDTLDELVGEQGFDWRELMLRTLPFAIRHGFMHRSERTVHEQMLFRLQRKRRPTRLFDIIEGRLQERNALATSQDIMRAAHALRSMGIGKGDRVAVVGLNSVRYLVVEGGIGLTGAVSVPLYYTSPVNEVQEILEDSGSRMLFIGSPALLPLVDDLPDIRCVSFCRSGGREGVMSWEDFLGSGDVEVELPPVSFEDLATIRYTSGTTGRPRGVVFDHGNLRWMAETIASLPPWMSRNQQVSYLSFLPMNHVVEGVLGTYSPYYAPAPLRLHFLEDFHSLRRALSLVRPSIFFSVPRFYEKMWDSFQGSVLGRMNDHLRREGGWTRRMLGRTLLRRAGLDNCRQLIVGSAPCSDDMLLDYRSLGIEVHNAYGLTEAPLITINRVGRNRIGTVGEPLPETELSISPEGEVLVKGRQVMRGYHPLPGNERTEWLPTGDLGSLTPEGSLVIEGRIKEVMIDSYGKNIMPAKVESLARQVPGVVDAMLIAESRPFASLLIWVDDGHVGMPREHWDREVERMGERLSDPERPKAWAILPYDLDIAKGEITPNLKIRRQVLMHRYERIVQAFYSGASVAEGAFHLGREVRK
jgi:long-chain acyl-CoA synthetase